MIGMFHDLWTYITYVNTSTFHTCDIDPNPHFANLQPLVKQETVAAETMQLRNLVSFIKHPSNMVIINLYNPGFDFLDLTLKIVS